MMEDIRSFETSVLTRATQRYIQGDGTLQISDQISLHCSPYNAIEIKFELILRIITVLDFVHRPEF
jgi:hypothetical protein